MKTILYTGARSGLAKNVIDKFINKNYLIYLTVETDAQLKEIAKIYKNVENIKYFRLNVKNKNDIENIKKLHIDILVCNAAVGYGGAIAEMNIDKIRDNFEVNVFQNFTIVQTVLQQMIQRNQGRIIMMASLAGILPIPYLGSYCATKASIIKLTECLKLELKDITKNIEVILIEPGLYYTGFNQVMLENKYDELENGYFKEEIAMIRKRETLLLNLLEHKNFNSITNKIYKAIITENPKFIYRAPISQVVGAKIYQLIV